VDNSQLIFVEGAMLGRSIAVVGVLFAIALAIPAGALSLYGELLTSHASLLFPGDVRARAILELDTNPFDVDWGTAIVGSGLGAGDVGSGQALTFVHRFMPGEQGATLEAASLLIGVRDDFDLEFEEAIVELDGQFWRQEQATLNLFGGEVTGFLSGNLLTVSISTALINGLFGGQYAGDFKVTESLFIAEYSSGVAHTPEPGAALLFGIGALMVQRRLRRR
jgi:hypothetical protein